MLFAQAAEWHCILCRRLSSWSDKLSCFVVGRVLSSLSLNLCGGCFDLLACFFIGRQQCLLGQSIGRLQKGRCSCVLCVSPFFRRICFPPSGLVSFPDHQKRSHLNPSVIREESSWHLAWYPVDAHSPCLQGDQFLLQLLSWFRSLGLQFSLSGFWASTIGV